MQNQNQEKLLQIFTYRWNWIIKEHGSWKTVKTRISDPTLIKIYEDPTKLIGVGFDKHTKYLMLDIDKNSPYHPKNDPNGIPLLELTLYKIGLKENIKIQSSQSGGIHIYYPFSHKLKSYKIGAKITQYLEINGWTVKNGTLEIFPNQKKDNYSQDKNQWKLYQRHRLPLQPESSSYLLDSQYQPIIDHPKPLDSFLEQWENVAKAQDIKELKRYLYLQSKKSPVLAQIEKELNQVITEGFTGRGQTNDILLALGRKIRLCRQLGGVELRDTIRHTVTHLRGYEEYCGHQYEIHQRSQDIARWAETTYPLAWEKKSKNLPKPKTNNNIKTRDALNRIIEALKIVIGKEYKNITAFVKEICSIAKCSASTLYKHQKIWREKVKLKMVCNSSQGESLSAIEVPKKEQEQNNLKPITSKEFKQKQEQQTKKDKNVCNARERKGLSLDFLEKYILRIYMLSLCSPEKKEIKKNTQKAVRGKSEESCFLIEKLEVVTLREHNQTIDGETRKINGGESEALESEPARLTIEQSGMIGDSPELKPLNSELGVKLGKPSYRQSSLSGGSSGDTPTVAQESVNSSAHSNNDLVAEDKLIQERSKFLKGLGIEIPEKLAELVNKATMEQVNNLRQLLKENKTLNNPVGFLIKALKNNWQPKQKTSTPSKPSWQEEFEEFYNQAIKAGYCEDLPINYLSRNHRNEPMVRVNKPDSWLGAPYTLVYWREAMQEFWGNNDK